ncbi:MAG: hypothetical protein LBJ60_00380 [Tannerellaceae bacterium]|jgi:hypothetical protein|nr:hypothetical protein [Tannerellaceae bacterium]
MNEVDESMRKYIRRWRGLTDEKFENINNLTDLILDHALWKFACTGEARRASLGAERRARDRSG